MKLNHKRFNSLRVGRINSRAEARKHLLLRNNLEKRFNKNLKTLFRKFVNVQLYLYKQYGIYEPSVAVQALNEDFIPLLTNHYRKTFQAIYKLNEDKYFTSKNADAFVFGRSVDIENLVAVYFATRQIQLSGISIRMANQISQKIEARKALLIADMTEDFMKEEKQITSQFDHDPLLKLKQREVDLKAMDAERKMKEDEARINLDRAKMVQAKDLNDKKLDQNEDLAQLRADTAIEKSMMSADVKLTSDAMKARDVNVLKGRRS